MHQDNVTSGKHRRGEGDACKNAQGQGELKGKGQFGD